jgi:hypothetical protein
MSEVWKFLKETLPKYQWAENERNSKVTAADTEDLTLQDSENKEDYDKDGGKDNKGKNKTAKGKNSYSIFISNF